ncbi:MAG: AraC family transcriptional regulator [Pseudomonadota bacterium]
MGRIEQVRADVGVVVYHAHNPVGSELASVARLKESNPSTPFIVTVPFLVKGLGVWALRARMWNCVVLLQDVNYFHECVKMLMSFRNQEYSPPRKLLASRSSAANAMTRQRLLATHRAVEVIAERYSQKITVEEVATLCGMDVTRFARVFKKEHGVTLRDYIKKMRLGHARYLLQETDGSIQSIAFDVGYEEIALFNRIFKGELGVTPSEYRVQKR